MDVPEYRRQQLAEMSDRYLEALLEVRRTEVEELEWEQRRRSVK